MKLLNTFTEAERELHEYFGYKEDWVKIPIVDFTHVFWTLTGEKHGDCVHFNYEDEHDPDDKSDDRWKYSFDIYTQRFLPKWVYRREDYTMICVDTNTDGNKYLAIFDNSKEEDE